jgi:hypothetical protein
LQSIRSGATEILGRGIELSSDLSDVVITFTDKPTRLIGSITDGQNALARDTRLVIFPVDDSFWTVTGSRLASRVRVVTPTPPPSFAVTLWPGTYFVAAVTGDLPESWETPEFLRIIGAECCTGNRRAWEHIDSESAGEAPTVARRNLWSATTFQKVDQLDGLPDAILLFPSALSRLNRCSR